MSNREPNLNKDNFWVRNDRDFAVRIEERDLRLIRDSGLRVEEGTRAMLFEDGKLVETLRPGFVDMKSHKGGFLWRLLRNPERLVVILTDDADAIVEFSFDRLITRDNREVAIATELVFAIEHPAIFFKNMMRSRKSVYYDDFERRYSREVSDALSEAVAGFDMEGLGQTKALKSDIAVKLDEHMHHSLKSDGLKLIDVRSVRWTSDNLARLRRDREHRSEIDDMLQEISHARDDEGVRETLHDADMEALIGKLRRAREQVQVLDDDEFEKIKQSYSNNLRKIKAEVEAEAEEIPWRKKRLEQTREWQRYINKYEITDIEEKFDSEKILRKLEIDNEKDKLFTQEEMEELVSELQVRAMNRGDKVSARMTVSKKLRLKEELELKLLEIAKYHDINSELYRVKQAQAKQAARDRQEFEIDALKHDIDKANLEADKRDIARQREMLAKREEEIAKNKTRDETLLAELKRKLEHAKTDGEVEVIKLELKEKKMHMGMEALKMMDEQEAITSKRKLLEEEEIRRIRREDTIQIRIAETDIKRKEMEMRLTEDKQAHDNEMEKLINKQGHQLDLGNLPIEKIIALTDENPGEAIRRLKQDEYFKDMDPEQIKMAQLKDLPPHIAKVLEGQMQMVEAKKLQEVKDAHYREMQDIQERNRRDDRDRWDRERDDAAREKRDFQDAMFRSRDNTERNIADILKASNSGNSAPLVVVPGQGQVTVPGNGTGNGGSGGGSNDVIDIRCPKCGLKITREVNFCPKCGNKLSVD